MTGEVVFTTGMSGYQESMTDPCFARQLITFTTAHVGNYGVGAAAMESDRIHAAGAIMRAAVDTDDAPGAEQGWLDWLAANGVPGDRGRRYACARAAHPRRRARCAAGSSPPTCRSRGEGACARRAEHGRSRPRARGHVARAAIEGEGGRPRIVALDTGIKRSIVRNFMQRGVQLELYPCTTPADELLARDPDGFFLVPGPGDPAALDYIVDTIRALLRASRCSGSASATSCSRRAAGLDTFKLPFGHRGANHPVKDLATGRIAITSQNHGFAVAGERRRRGSTRTSAPPSSRHVNLYDGTVEGFRAARRARPAASSTTRRPARGRTTRSACSTSSSAEFARAA